MAQSPSASAAVLEEISDAAKPNFSLDCYPYTFSPLLLFAQEGYFDKGYSNYNSVAQFFKDALRVDMLENVLYDRKNMPYEELLKFVIANKMLVPCCIEAHFTAMQVLSHDSAIYYDPLSRSLKLVTGENFLRLAGFLLLKCALGDSQHMQDNKAHYVGSESNTTRRMLYRLWEDIHQSNIASLYLKWNPIPLDLDRYLLINGQTDPHCMSTQLTGNTCYFQTFLFGVLCKVGQPQLAGDCVQLQCVDELEAATRTMSLFMLNFFVEEETKRMRPLTNSNFVIDFFGFRHAPYFALFTKYLQHQDVAVPDYERQYQQTLAFFHSTRTLHSYSKFTLSGPMSTSPNSKSLMPVSGTDDAVWKLARSNYYKYRACNIMFGFNTGIMMGLKSFCEFNSLRKNQLLGFYDRLQHIFGGCCREMVDHKYRDYYFMPQYEIGQQELIDVHHYGFVVDMCSLYRLGAEPANSQEMISAVNKILADHVYFSTQQRSDYDKILSLADFKRRDFYQFFENCFLSIPFFSKFMALGFSEINPKEKEINSLSQSVFYMAELMRGQEYRMEHEFEKECINQMARSTSRKYLSRLEGDLTLAQNYTVSIAIGMGFTYSKYNTLMHFLNVMENYWQNPDLNSVQVFGKDIRALLVTCCQKIFFHDGHPSGFYHYGVMLSERTDFDLAVASSLGVMPAGVTRQHRGNRLVLTDRVYEFHYLRSILEGIFTRARKVRVKSDNSVLNLLLLSLMLDFGLYEEHAELLNLPFLKRLQRLDDKRQLQVEVANSIHEFDRKNSTDSVTRIKLEELLFEASHKFLVNKNFPVLSKENELIQQLSADPAYQQHLLLCKVNMSLCQINKSVEVDYYKVRLEVDGRHGEFRTIIPRNFSKATSDHLEEITKRYTFSERAGIIIYDELPLFNLNSPQPEIDLFRVRFDSMTDVHSMVKYIEIKNVFQALSSANQFMFFIADNCLLIEMSGRGLTIRINKIAVEVATIFFNEAISFVPCFKYADSEDVILFASSNVKYLVDQGGQFCNDYYGMKHELIENIKSEETFVDLNDEHVFKDFKLSELLTESKTVVYFPDFILQVPSRQELINLLDLAIHIRNVSFFVLVLFYLRRSSVKLEFVEKERSGRDDIVKITGPWMHAIKYVLNKAPNAHYESIFSKQFFDLNQHSDMPLAQFIDVLCENFTKYQRHVDGGHYQIVPTAKQKAFLQRIVCSEECFHFSEVGSGKTKVILPLLCQLFLSNNSDAHRHLARGGEEKNVLVVLVPEHLVADARAQVFRYCLNLNFREQYRIYDDIFALLHDDVLGSSRYSYSLYPAPPSMKMIFITSFNQFKKALTYDKICQKVWQYRERFLVLTDEVDDFLDRDKLVFNICSNKSNTFDRATLELYFEVSHAAYNSQPPPQALFASSGNPEYWSQLHEKLCAIHAEIQDASKSVNKAFGIFNEHTLRHCSTNIAHDVEGYKSLIARPYESVNRAMPGSYYSDVERTIFLTFVILNEDIVKYDELFQQERKFISFEYWSAHVSHLDYDDLVYGQQRLSELVAKFPETKDGLVRFLYEIILRRMEIRDKSRSVNSIDIVFNFDCIGFTGTPFIDNYPTYSYIRRAREDKIPSMIDRSFYAYTSDALSQQQFQDCFSRFQGTNSNVLVEYVSSDFIRSAGVDELAILEQIFAREERSVVRGGAARSCFNVLVDLCGIFKRSTIHDVRDLVLRHFGPDKFHYVYHIDQADSHDRVLSVNSDNDVQFDEEFFKFLCKTYGAAVSEKVFFFVDNRNVIGKDIPFQLLFQRRFAQPLFTRSVVLAHDVDDFSKIWQAMGRSRTMNHTHFSIYMNGVALDHESGVQDIKTHALTRQLYVRNCDQKMAGNLSSIYQTLISLFNLSKESFYFCDSIVNTFLEKMTGTITTNVRAHAEQLERSVLRRSMPSRIFAQILGEKFKRSAAPEVAALATEPLSSQCIEQILREIIQQKFEQRVPSQDKFDAIIRLLSGEQQSLMEISYTKQQQKQKQKQQNKNQDSDTMDSFARRHQLEVSIETDNYYKYTSTPVEDIPKIALSLPIPVPVVSIAYALEDGKQRTIKVFPTLQFLYSHHIQAEYMTQEVKDAALLSTRADFVYDPEAFCRHFVPAAASYKHSDSLADAYESSSDEFAVGQLVVLQNYVTLAQYNGQRGKIVSYNAFRGLWIVELELDKGILETRTMYMQAVRPTAPAASADSDDEPLLPPLPQVKIIANFLRQNPLYSLAALQEGVYVIGMKDQFNVHDLHHSPLRDRVQYIVDEMGFVLFDRTAAGSKSVDSFGPYFIEQYILMEVLSKQEVAQNVLDYYVNHKQTLQDSLAGYSEEQGKGFICWRFLMKDSSKGKACGSPVLRALARKKVAVTPKEPEPAPPKSFLGRMAGFLLPQ